MVIRPRCLDLKARTGAQLVSVLAALVAVICVSSAFPYFDPRFPFRFERFTGPFWIIGVGLLDIEGANKAFLKYLPIGTPTVSGVLTPS
jgi:hypothetical protein